MWPNSNETQELIVSAKAGDAAAAGELLERHRESLHRLVSLRADRAIQGRVDASDIVQDALIEANRRLSDYLQEPRMPFHLWLRQIAKDRIIDAHRRHRGAGQRSVDREQSLAACQDQSALDLAAQLRDGRELTPATAMLRQELQERFRAALAQLDETDREIIEMRHFEQLANQDVAQALSLSEAAAGMRYLRAMRRLRALLDEVPSARGDA